VRDEEGTPAFDDAPDANNEQAISAADDQEAITTIDDGEALSDSSDTSISETGEAPDDTEDASSAPLPLDKLSAFDGIDFTGASEDKVSFTAEQLAEAVRETEAEEEESGDVREKSRRPGPYDLEGMSFDERVEHLRKRVVSNPLQREINYKTLRFCCDRHTLPEVEDFIGAQPEFEGASQSQFFLLRFLLLGGGIDVFEVDENGEEVTAERKEGLTEDEIDDLVVTNAYETNEYGREVVELMSPQRRILDLLSITPEFYDTFVEVMQFVCEKREFSEVNRLLRGRDVLTIGRAPGEPLIQPSVFIDKLEQAGGIYWEKGWIITEEGREVMETLLKRKGEDD